MFGTIRHLVNGNCAVEDVLHRRLFRQCTISYLFRIIVLHTGFVAVCGAYVHGNVLLSVDARVTRLRLIMTKDIFSNVRCTARNPHWNIVPQYPLSLQRKCLSLLQYTNTNPFPLRLGSTTRITFAEIFVPLNGTILVATLGMNHDAFHSVRRRSCDILSEGNN